MIYNEEDLTIFHIENDNIEKMYLKGNFRDVKKSMVKSNGEVDTSNGIARIPANNSINISEGDYFIRGHIEDDYNLENLMSKYRVYFVTSVSDNHLSNIPHYKVEVNE